MTIRSVDQYGETPQWEPGNDSLGKHPMGLHRELLRARKEAQKAVGRYESHLRAYQTACRENGVRPYHPFDQ